MKDVWTCTLILDANEMSLAWSGRVIMVRVSYKVKQGLGLRVIVMRRD